MEWMLHCCWTSALIDHQPIEALSALSTAAIGDQMFLINYLTAFLEPNEYTSFSPFQLYQHSRTVSWCRSQKLRVDLLL